MSTESFYIGSYTVVDDWIPNATGAGITTLEFELQSGRLSRGKPAAEVPNPSYLTTAPGGEFLYACSELFYEDGTVWAFAVEPDGSLRAVSKRSSMGRATCHVAVDAERSRVLASSYLNGRVAGYAAAGGRLGEEPEILEYEGTGPNLSRQESSHPHQVVLRGGAYFVPDLGADRIWVHAADDLRLRPRGSIETPAGYGPRHVVFHPELSVLYVVCELTPRVLVYEYRPADDTWLAVGDHACERAEHAGTPAPAAVKLHPSGRSLTVSNRFSDSLQQFGVDSQTGGLTEGRNVPLQGRTPRDFGFSADGSRLIALCQDSNEAFSYPVDTATGVMGAEPTDRIEIGTPVCIVPTGR